MEWDDLKYVLATARSGSFLRAGHLLKVTHTTVGRRVKALETDLGQPLFRRKRDGVEPTEVCLSILPTAERMEDEVRRLPHLLAAREKEPEGEVRIHTAAWMLEHVLIPALPKLFAEAPKVRVFLIGDVVESIRDTKVPSVSLRFDVMAKSTEIETTLAVIPFAVYVRRDLDPATLPWVTNSGGNVVLRTHGWLDDQGVSPDEIRVLANDAELVRAAIRAGLGKGLIPMRLGEAAPELLRVSDGRPELVRRYRSVVSRRVATRDEVRVVMNWITATVADAWPSRAPGTTG